MELNTCIHFRLFNSLQGGVSVWKMPLRTTKNKMRDINRLEAAVRKIEASVDVKREEVCCEAFIACIHVTTKCKYTQSLLTYLLSHTIQLEKANADISRTERQIRKQQEKMGSYAALHATEKNSKAQRFGAAVVQVRTYQRTRLS